MNTRAPRNSSTREASMPIELAELVLTSAIHRTAAISLWNPTSIAQPLNLDLMQWWQSRGYLGSDPGCSDRKAIEYLSTAVRAATRAGHVHVLEWLLDRYPVIFYKVCQDEASPPIMKVAAEAGKVDVVQWWFDMCSSDRLGKMPPLAHIVAVALGAGNVPLLEWCRVHPLVVAQFKQDAWRCQFALAEALGTHTLDWFDFLGIAPTADEYKAVASFAYAVANVDALKWLQERGQLTQCRLEPLHLTMVRNPGKHVDKVLPMLEWIHGNVALDSNAQTADRTVDIGFMWGTSGYVKALDWFVSRGYKLDRDIWKPFFAHVPDGDIQVRDWLVSHFDISLEQLAAVAQDMDCYPLLDVDIWKWWLDRVGPVESFAKHFRDFSSFYNPSKNPRCVSIVKLWIESGGKLDFPACIQAASCSGNVAVLDWFLNTLKVPIDHFAAWAALRPSYKPDALLWWWANITRVHAVRKAVLLVAATEGTELPLAATVRNPIKAHMLKSMLKFAHFAVPSAFDLCDSDNVAMLKYLWADPVFRCELLDEDDLKVAIKSAHGNKKKHLRKWWKSIGKCDE
ncbi:hypothetical protein BCR44DRAFT_48656 [Catenaria anguillulae PL171]|uniref:Ankyrin repeat-containing domain protein n=1 Tax=Catenaria anguillulae PL171 TaxID=765915 RepID=A0A1Y2HPN5_9FUNG|nr:hypothetical protein BCR44DRAFT_48656 [Catenaria anguillulae PL171]